MKTSLRLLKILILYSSIVIGQKTDGSKNPLELRKENIKKNYKTDFINKTQFISKIKEISINEIKRSSYITESDLYISFLNNKLKVAQKKDHNPISTKKIENKIVNEDLKKEINAEIEIRSNFCKNRQTCNVLLKKPRGCPKSTCKPSWNKLEYIIITPYIQLEMNFYNKSSKTSVGTIGKPMKIKGTQLYAYPVILKENLKSNYYIKVNRKNNANKTINYNITERIWKS